MDEIKFKPLIDLSGFRVISEFDSEKMKCDQLVASPVKSLGVLLYPSELFNEKFLINIRGCLSTLSSSHPLKKWLINHTSASNTHLTDSEMVLLSDVLSSPFNLISDFKIKNQVINLIAKCPEKTVVEKILKSYLYLMIGNITRSDNIFRSIISKNPRENYKGYKLRNSHFHQVALQNLEKMLLKFSRHPADRRIYALFAQYVTKYMNESGLIAKISDSDNSVVSRQLHLSYLEKIAPEFVKFLRLEEVNSPKKDQLLLDKEKYPSSYLTYWVLPFIDQVPTFSENLSLEFKRIEIEDPLWLIYLLDNERSIDLYIKHGGSLNLPARRAFLRSQLSGDDFMLAFYKLLELGDVDESLVLTLSDYITQDG